MNWRISTTTMMVKIVRKMEQVEKELEKEDTQFSRGYLKALAEIYLDVIGLLKGDSK